MFSGSCYHQLKVTRKTCRLREILEFTFILFQKNGKCREISRGDWWELSGRVWLVGGVWWEVSGGMCLVGGVWWDVSGGWCLVGCVWWVVSGGKCAVELIVSREKE